MNLRYIQKIWNLKTLLILTLFYGKSNLYVVSDLKLTCVYEFPSETVGKDFIIVPDNICTAKALDGYYNRKPQRKKLSFNEFKGKIPYVHIYGDVFTLSSMKKKVNPKNVETFVSEMIKVINRLAYDVLLFHIRHIDIQLTKKNDTHEEDEIFHGHLKSFFERMKSNRTNMLFGLTIPKENDLAVKAFNPKILQNSVDFYVIKSYNYDGKCEYHNDPKNIRKPATREKMKETINKLVNVGYNREKLFLTILIEVKRMRRYLGVRRSSIWSYTTLCQAKPNSNARYCDVDTLENYYEQGQLASEENLAGVFIYYVDFDDYEGKCGCGKFPATKAIEAGVEGNHAVWNNLEQCRTFGTISNERYYSYFPYQ